MISNGTGHKGYKWLVCVGYAYQPHLQLATADHVLSAHAYEYYSFKQRDHLLRKFG